MYNYHLKSLWPICLGEHLSLFSIYSDDALLFLNCRMRDDCERDTEREIKHTYTGESTSDSDSGFAEMDSKSR